MDFTDLIDLFRFEMSPLELVVRGTAMYWFLFLLFRFVLRRDPGSIAIADVLLLVLIADASQDAMTGGYRTIAEGMVVVATIAGWNYLLDWSCYRFDAVRRFVEPKPLLLVRRGRILRENLRKELLTIDDLLSKLRANGIDDVSKVKSAHMEADGQISVVRIDGGPVTPPDARKKQSPVG